MGEGEDAQPRLGILLDDALDAGGHGPEHELGRAHHISAVLPEGDGGELALGGEGQERRRMQDGRRAEAV